MEDLNQSLEKVTNNTFIKIDGYLVEKAINPETGKEALKWGNHFYKDEDAVKAAVKEACRLLSISIVNPNGESKKLGPEIVEKYHKGESGYNSYKEEQK